LISSRRKKHPINPLQKTKIRPVTEMDLKDGTVAVETARRCAEAETNGGGAAILAKKRSENIGWPASFSEKKGVFVTISEYPSGDLRGCIGYPEPVFPFGDALRMSAIAACHDPRFFDLKYEETDRCTFEVTVLTVPEKVEFGSPEELVSKISIGRDGLIISHKGRRGLLLPQVPTEFGWDAEEFLKHLSLKAGLGPKAWKEPGVTIESFSGEIFSETSPRGEIVRK
jgi:uncharacterized protein (TIGR00296 family)